VSWGTPRLQDPAGTLLQGRGLGCARGHHLLLETWFWGATAPVATSRARLSPSLGRNCWCPPWGPAREGTLESTALGTANPPFPAPLLFSPLLPTTPEPPSLVSPHIVPSPRWRQPPSPFAPAWTGRSPGPPSPPTALGGHVGSPGSVTQS